MIKRVVYIIFLLLWVLPLRAESGEEADSLSSDGNIITRVMGFFDRAGEDKTLTKSVDWGVIGGVGYSQERGFGLSANLTGGYRLDRTDSISSPSWFAVMLSATLKSYYAVESVGSMFINSEKHQIDHSIEYSSGMRYLWGRGYYDALYSDPLYYRLNSFISSVEYRYALYGDFSLGGIARYQLYRGFGIDDLTYINNEATRLQAGGVGLIAEYDTRDNIHSATQGQFISLQGVVYPKGMSSLDNTLYKGYLSIATFHTVWRGGVVCGGLQGEFSGRGTPWAMLSSLSDYGFMRGYYIGRFVDNNMVSIQAELRQHVWWRLSAAGWVGCGNIYSSIDSFDISQTLPNYGVGIRFKLKESSIARVDMGFGRDTFGVILRYSEAF